MKNYFKYSLFIVLVAVLIVPMTAKAATTAEIQAQIQAIMAQIQLLQQLLVFSKNIKMKFWPRSVSDTAPVMSANQPARS